MSKVRIHDLAKQYGMSGKDFAHKLRDLGFSQAKSHMSALDEFEVLQAQGILEAHGVIGERAAVPTPQEVTGGLILRKKKKKKKVEPPATEAPGEVEPAATVAQPTPADAPAKLETEEAGTAPPLPEPEQQPEAATQAGQAVGEPSEPVESAPVAETTEVAPVAATVEEGPGGAETETAPEAPASTGEPDAAATPKLEAAEPAVEGAPKKAAVKTPESPKPRGRVVGFIDPSSFQAREPQRRTTQSRRLQSRDEAAPDVRPTFTHDRGRGPLRGAGGARGNLTAAQLREREQGRFLRRTRPGGPGMGGRRGPGAGPRYRDRVTESPLAGTTVKVQAPVTIQKLAEAIKLKANVVLKSALTSGLGSFTINAVLDDDTTQLLGHEFDIEFNVVHEIAAEAALLAEFRQNRDSIEDEELIVRPPTVAFLGHVDHGKTTLIDCIRQSRVAEHEAGGITQHIGAYQVKTKLGHFVTIIDTPGHAAFTAMRARGAKAVDIVVLVVAGDDGVKPHTEEALNHAKAAGAPIIVAITKSDKPDYNAKRAMEQLASLGLTPEEWSGETAMLQVSALKNEGVEELLERVFLEGELLELRAHPSGPASGVVLEAEVQQGKGIVAHLLIQDGSLNRGDVILAGEGYGKVRSIHNDRGETLQEAGPSMPVEVTGLDALPGVGDAFHKIESLAKAKQVAVERERNNRAVAMAAKRSPAANLEQILGSSQVVEQKSINLIVRADVQGSVEVLKFALAELTHEEVAVRILNIGVGPISESDVNLATTSSAILVAFHVGVNGKARKEAERAGLELARFDVIYELLDFLHDRMEGALAPDLIEEVVGHVEIRRLFKSSRIGSIAGCMVLDGTVARNNQVRLIRSGQVLHTGAIGSLRREKDEAKEVREGFECGIVLKDFRDIQEGDIIEAFKMVEVKRTLADSAKS
ncbi:MAG: translation initiation factor IF-2 [Planctomycetota bacterium]|nr:MAG: translation initiation factor IF-2 [Planctomycetota bacterium]